MVTITKSKQPNKQTGKRESTQTRVFDSLPGSISRCPNLSAFYITILSSVVQLFNIHSFASGFPTVQSLLTVCLCHCNCCLAMHGRLSNSAPENFICP